MCKYSERLTRRQWLAGSGAALGAMSLGPWAPAAAASAPALPVSIARCPAYSGDVAAKLAAQFDQIGGLGSLVKGKTVTIKLNLTGGNHFPGYTASQTHWVHPRVVGACCHLLGNAGARRIRLVEGAGEGESVEDKLLEGGWDLKAIMGAAAGVEFEETNARGAGKRYSRLKVAKPFIYPGFDLNHAYEDTDVFVSLAKLKQHEETGITLGIKNVFGITPNSIYGDDAGVDEPNEKPASGREQVLHYGNRQPSKSAPQEVDPKSNRYEGYRVPRICVDLIAARPVDLTVIDGIESMAGGEGPWVRGSKPTRPGLLIVGRNVVCTDTVAVAAMGFDPRSKRSEGPFHVFKTHNDTPNDPMWADNPMLLAEAVGLGSADLKQIEVRGVPIRGAVHDFEAVRMGKG
jgi:uncharacterized protein (DUF362 family)